MTETTRSRESSASGATLYLACRLGSTKWTLGFAVAPAQHPRLRQIAAGDTGALGQEIVAAKRCFGLAIDAPEFRRSVRIGRARAIASTPCSRRKGSGSR
jgi:hypothetical protein